MGRSRRAGARPRLRRKLPGWIQPMPDSEPAVKAKLAAIGAYTGPGHTHGEPHEDGQARRGHRPVDAGEGAQRDGDPMLDGARGVYGVVPCKGVVFHCSNLPKSFFVDQRMDYQAIIAGTVGKENTFGTIVGRVSPGPFTYCRVSTDDLEARVASYVGEGRFTDDVLDDTFGGYGVVEVRDFQRLLQTICRRGFEHHIAATRATVADTVGDALDTYMEWDLCRHQ